LKDKIAINLEKTAGPATVVLATIDAEKYEELTSILRKPTTIVGEIL
jgi:hypothetical protein